MSGNTGLTAALRSQAVFRQLPRSRGPRTAAPASRPRQCFVPPLYSKSHCSEREAEPRCRSDVRFPVTDSAERPALPAFTEPCLQAAGGLDTIAVFTPHNTRVSPGAGTGPPSAQGSIF